MLYRARLAAQAVAKKKEIQRRIGKPVVTDGYEDVSALCLALPQLLARDKRTDCPGVTGHCTGTLELALLDCCACGC